jgi:hypothetical protein
MNKKVIFKSASGFSIFLIVLALAMLFGINTAGAAVDTIRISCPTGTPVIDVPSKSIRVQDSLFFLKQTACASNISISGNDSIGVFTLTTAAPKKGIIFASDDRTAADGNIYNYTASIGANNANGQVNVSYNKTPSLTEWGVLFLLIMLIGTTVWILRKKSAGAEA